jgi:small subunit ribosomal protein S21
LTKVSVRDGEAVERAIKRFKRKVEQAGILKEVRKREHYLKPSVKSKLKARAAEARARKREKRLLQTPGPV